MSLEPVQPEILNEDAREGLIILCDHASNVIPAGYDNLGLEDHHLEAHIAWDIGAAEVTRKMCELMGVSAVLAPVSRLVIDCNRELDAHGLIPAVSDDVKIPANSDLSAAAMQARVQAYYDPFHAAAARLVKAHLDAGKVPLVVGMHSFTPEMAGEVRPWHAGFLWNRDPRLAQAMIGLLERETDLVVGDNLPYSGKQLYHTMERHGAAHGLPQTTIEIRQDLLASPGNIDAWAALMADVLDECMSRPDLTAIKHF
ncbi:N-formylglutamate amidohydrolase [Kordiimonas marina]|uniref:N-formylglutamate amidohydrolase n=1 Tax=Kordiimonas marina TaxID=2872312 RepID=UPI001FF2E512|nr:N-formylglutamate amidohydrolase [Kordiimonas marina]MCJ9427993.1 N-formylglutamate amidohydrolase [Kordiimonas marina]